ncbi:hypothetical protein BOTCAL_0050g00310 [Botryotinia calthae]|uniref:Uncharacterized protein n=1 Tax=Botryotinia calthae TaxID=38488 RepID=A0A4Y8DDH1_9HELO|nr:hypothetical protein BOTCAL_0050g00310 [Botryotinia calthae]
MPKKHLRPETGEKNDPSTSSGSGRSRHTSSTHRSSRDSGHRSSRHHSSDRPSAAPAHLSSGVGQGERSSSSAQSSSSQAPSTGHSQGYGRGALAQDMTSMSLSQTATTQPALSENCDYRAPNNPCSNPWTKHWQQVWKFRCDWHPVDKFPQKGMFCHKVKVPEKRDADGRITRQERLCGEPTITKEFFLNENFVCRACEPPVRILACTFWLITENQICGIQEEVIGDRDDDEDPHHRCPYHKGLAPEITDHVHFQAQKRLINGRQPFADTESFEQLPAEGGILDDRLPSARGRENYPRDMGQGKIAPPARRHMGRGGMPVVERYEDWDPENRAGTPQPGGYGTIEPEPVSAPLSDHGYSELTSSEPSYQQTTYQQSNDQQSAHQELTFSESPQTFPDQPITKYRYQKRHTATIGEVDSDIRAGETFDTRPQRVRREQREAVENMEKASRGFAGLDKLYDQNAKKRRK